MGGGRSAAAASTAAGVCYRGEGLTWDGQGEMSSWLKLAVNAGQSVEFYRVGSL